MSKPFKNMDRRVLCMILGAILFVVSFSFASAIETAGGRTRVERINF
ncbi:MAG: hypothetical protein IJ240_07315 [Clostridia bacterium]|nr:hypothetical protein [Clostridia bacterium]